MTEQATAPKNLLVCAGLIIGDDPDTMLVTRRKAGDHLGGKWEFPGGKVEPLENPRDALAREIEEEIAVTVEVGRVVEVLFDASPRYVVTMVCFVCRKTDDRTPQMIEVDEWRWVPIAELDALDFVPADVPFVRELAEAARAGRSPLASFTGAI